MIHSKPVGLEERLELEKRILKKYPNWSLEWSPAFKHYYITDKKTKEKSDNISYYELKSRYKNKEI